MILLAFLYDEYIVRPKLSEQKKPFEYIVLPPASGVGTIIEQKAVRGEIGELNSVSLALEGH